MPKCDFNKVAKQRWTAALKLSIKILEQCTKSVKNY